jgi:hypothetical protein
MKTTQERSHKRNPHTQHKTYKPKKENSNSEKTIEVPGSRHAPRSGFHYGREKQDYTYIEAEEA